LYSLPGGRKGPVAAYHSKEGGGLAAIDDLDRYYPADPCLYIPAFITEQIKNATGSQQMIG